MRRFFRFQESDLVMISKERHPKGTYNKINVKKIGSCRVRRKFGNNAYEVDLQKELDISAIFNVKNLYDFVGYDSDEVAKDERLDESNAKEKASKDR